MRFSLISAGEMAIVYYSNAKPSLAMRMYTELFMIDLASRYDSILSTHLYWIHRLSVRHLQKFLMKKLCIMFALGALFDLDNGQGTSGQKNLIFCMMTIVYSLRSNLIRIHL